MYYAMLDDELLYDPRAKGYEIFDPKLSLEVNKNGTFTFTIHQYHPLYNRIAKRKSIVEIYQDNALRFRGRVLDDQTALSNAKTVTVEGEMTYFNDTILRPYEYTGSVEGYLSLIIDQHNTQVGTDKQFKLGKVTVTDPNDVIVRSDSTYPKTWDVVEDKLIKSLGGYLMIRRENGVNYLDYLADSDYKSDQTIELGKNILDLKKTSSATGIYTAILPLGTQIKDEDGNDTGERLTVKSVNDDNDVIVDDEAVAKYGYIIEVVTWDDVTLADNLLRKAKVELAELVKMDITLELTAVDLANAGQKVNHFRLFEYVQVTSKPHDVDELLLAEKLELNLTNPAADKLTIGLQRKSLTDKQVSTSKVINKVQSDYVVNEKVREIQQNATEKYSEIKQDSEKIGMEVAEINKGVKEQSELLSDQQKQIRQALDDIDEANSQLTDLSADGKLTPNEKQQLKKEWDVIASEKPQLDESASSYGVDTTGLGTAYDSLTAFLTPLLSDLTTTSTADGATLRTDFQAYYDAKLVTMNSINNVIQGNVIDANEDTKAWTQEQLAAEADSIRQQSDEDYATKDELVDYQSTVSTQFEQTKDDFLFQFTNILEQISNIDGDTKTQFQQIVKYIRFEDGNIILGQVGNEVTLKIQNDRIGFLQSGNEVAYINNNKLYITDGEFLNSLRLGNFAFVPRENGNLSFKWVGGESV
ncbi:phage tail protein [Lapidilactobacillus mulanensis]|uniref:Phage tail protein n=1 Tax=Lapidilactobacillus mulanensis TaxID=2485999 RepID=A0ABW4DRM6_9LACO|nr:phage tail protein [Lapidilactobacillus mulanensis]